jgi:uncharacterized protein involved in exopolysaccharide biosynthesis
LFTEKTQTIRIREIIRVLSRRRKLIAIPAAVTVLGALAGVLVSQPSYESVATLALETSVPLTRTVAQASGVDDRFDDQAQILRRRIESSSFLESVAVQVGLHEDPKIKQRAEQLARQNPQHDKNDILLRECVKALQRMLDVYADGSHLFYIRAVSHLPERAHAVASSVAERYIESTREGRLRQNEEAFTFAQEQVAIYERKLDEKRRELRRYEQEASLKPLTASPVSEQNVGRVSNLLSAAQADVQFRKGRAELARQRVTDADLDAFASLNLIRSERLGALQRTVLELERHVSLTLVEYPDRDPAVQSLKNQIAVQSQLILAEAEAQAKQAFPTLPEESVRLLADLEFARMDVTAAETRYEALNELRSRYADDLANVSSEELRLNRLKEEVDGAERLYETWLEQANSTQIAKAVETADVANPMVLIEPARRPLEPFAPQKKKIMAMALALGVVLGIAAAIVTEYFDLTLVSVEEVESVLGVPILGAVPRLQAAVLLESQLRARARVRWVIAGTAVAVLVLAAVGYWVFVGPPAVG